MFGKLFDFGGKNSNNVRSVRYTQKKMPNSNNNVTNTQLQSKIVIGKVYAEWCRHCQILKPEWDIMKNNIENKFPNKYIFSDIDDKNSKTSIEKINKMFVSGSNPKLIVNGFPTIYKIINGKVEYYNGNRKAPDMEKWFLNSNSVGGKYNNKSKRNKSKRKQSLKNRK